MASRSLFLALGLWLAFGRPVAAVEPQDPGRVTLQSRYQVQQFKGIDKWEVVNAQNHYAPDRVAIVICDVWDKHWCKSATQRCDTLAKNIAIVTAAARSRGVTIVHAPSDCMDFYRDSPARKRVKDAPKVEMPKAVALPDPPLPIDDSDGGCDDAEPAKNYRAWKQQHPAIVIDEAKDGISDNGQEIYQFLKSRKIDCVIYVGVHTNMCVLNRSFGIKAFTRIGMPCYLARDLTDTMYNPKKSPMVPHEEGTQQVIAHIEKHWCPTCMSSDLLPEKFASLPSGISSFGAAISDNYLYVYGGHEGKAHRYSNATVLNRFQRINLANPSQWEDLSSGPILQGLAMVSHRGSIYRIGGMQPRNKPDEPEDTISVASCEKYDPSTKLWTKLADLPEPRSSHDAVVLGDKLYVVGGWRMNGKDGKSEWLSTALVLDLLKPDAKWEKIKQPFERRALSAAAFDGKIYVFCGLVPSGALERTVNIYDPVKAVWTTGPQLPGPVMNGFSPAAAVADGTLQVSLFDGKIYQSDKVLGWNGIPIEDWRETATLREPRFVHRLLPVYGNVMLAVGGASNKGNRTSIEWVIPNPNGPISGQW